MIGLFGWLQTIGIIFGVVLTGFLILEDDF